MGYFPFIIMGLHLFLVLCGLYLLFSTYGVSFGPLGVVYVATRILDAG